MRGVLKRIRRKLVKAHVTNQTRAKQFYSELYDVLSNKD